MKNNEGRSGEWFPNASIYNSTWKIIGMHFSLHHSETCKNEGLCKLFGQKDGN